nr:hypothetical protein [Metarhizium brunneum polymycovirus 1]
MSDLTRLRTIVASGDTVVAHAAAVLYHFSSRPHRPRLLDAGSVSDSLRWVSMAPPDMYGEVVGGAGFTPDDAVRCGFGSYEGDAALVATMSNAMATQNSEWDRAVRDEYTENTTLHSAAAAVVPGQSSLEFAAMDVLREVGYAGLDDAASAIADLRLAIPNQFRVHTRQFTRSRHAVSARFVFGKDEVVNVLTPWCLSRKNAIAYVAVILHRRRRTHVEARVTQRAQTVTSYAARNSLEEVRLLVEPAIELLTRYTYSGARLAFINERGDAVQSVTSRAPYVSVAFAAVHMSSAVDVLDEMASRRAAITTGMKAFEGRAELSDYTEKVDDELSGLVAASRLLAAFRFERDTGPFGPRVNKGPMLGYIARAVTKRDRNTVACVNRMEEVVSLAAERGVGKDRLLLVVEWGGLLNHAAVLAAAAVSKVDICLDVAGSGLDLPGGDVMQDDEDRIYSYSLYLSSARSRRLPRMPTVEYPSGTPLARKLEMVYESLGGSASGYKIAYLSGGVATAGGIPVSICADSAARMDAIAMAKMTLPLFYSTVEVLLPKLCHHAMDAEFDEVLQCVTQVDSGCSQCSSHYRALMSILGALSGSEKRLAKARSMFLHNMHFAIEWCDGAPFGIDSTLLTLDSVVTGNCLRNMKWARGPVAQTPGADPVSPDLSDMMRAHMSEIYHLLSRSHTERMSEEYAGTIAASVAES